MFIFVVKWKIMQINYKFTSDDEPTDEQLRLLMHEIVIEEKRKADEANERFNAELQELVEKAKRRKLKLESDSK